MIVKQKGIRNRITRLIGWFSFVFAIFYVAFVTLALLLWPLDISIPADIGYLIFGILVNLLIGIWFALGGIYFVGLYPDLVIYDTGFVIHNFYFQSNIKWADIESIVETKGVVKAKALLLKRKGMLFNRLYGLFFIRNWSKPVIIVSSNAENLDAFDTILFQNLGLHIK